MSERQSKNGSRWLCGFVSGMIFLFFGFSGQAVAYDIKTGFKQGVGTRIGYVRQVEGEALIVHAGENDAYRAEAGFPLFLGDTLATGENGRILIGLNDESTITLAEKTKLTLNRHVYNPEKKVRQSFVKMLFGKARFVVRKLSGFRHSDVKVRTKTAILGVRGSDYAVYDKKTETDVAALENTQVDVGSVLTPEKSVRLNSFEEVTVSADGRVSKVRKLGREKVREIEQDFSFRGEMAGAGKKEFERTVLVPEEELVDPSSLGETEPDDIRSGKPEGHADLPGERIEETIDTHREGLGTTPQSQTPITFPPEPEG